MGNPDTQAALGTRHRTTIIYLFEGVFFFHPLRRNNHWYGVMPARGHIATTQSVINLQNLESFENNL